MCGIAGIRYLDGKRAVDTHVLERMTRVIAHRGPDDEGHYCEPGIGLGSRRLSIVDLAGGHQPMANEDRSLWVVFNGEIYNQFEHRQRLAQKHTFRTRSDTEVILHLYEEYGTRCPEYLNGIFGFAIWDARNRRLFLARDHLGVKPLYYYLDSEVLLFASEIKSFLEYPGFQPKLAVPAAAEYFNFGTPWGNHTFFHGVRLLEPGHCLVAERGSVHEKIFWDLAYAADYRDELKREELAKEKLGALLEDAVKLQLMSDVPLGCFLSGGIDSSTLTVLAHKYYPGKLRVFSAAFAAGELYDETPYAEIVARSVGADHHKIYLDAGEFQQTLPRLLLYLDEPRLGASIFPQYYVSRLARQHVKVCLGGQGGDELFGGYARYFLLQPWKNSTRFLWDKLKLTRRPSAVSANVQKQVDWGVLRWFLCHAPSLFRSPERRYFDHYRWMNGATRQALLAPDFLQALDHHDGFAEIEAIMEDCPFPDPLSRMSYLEVKTYLNGLLILEDRMSMANSLESRVPLLDYRLVELALHLPPEMKVRGLTSKYLLKRVAERWLPPEVLNKRKMGFPVPTGHWFQDSLKPWLREILLDPRTLQRGYVLRKGMEDLIEGRLLKGDRYWERVVWGFLNLELWHRIFVDGKGRDFRNAYLQPPRPPSVSQPEVTSLTP